MSRKYKFQNASGIYFVSFATVYWIDVFIRPSYADIIIDSLYYCTEQKGMKIYTWRLMPSHLHLIFSDTLNNLGKLLQEFKTHTSKQVQTAMAEHIEESRKEWMLWMMERAGRKNSNITGRQFWQQHNQPVELWSNKVFDQKINYIHQNPVESGFVFEAVHWRYSSAIDYSEGKGLVKITLLE